ncbi:MAG: glycosyltransferase [Bacilli bacterium]|nr:glycosyltransferase [Bacilli bacterium]
MKNISKAVHILKSQGLFSLLRRTFRAIPNRIKILTNSVKYIFLKERYKRYINDILNDEIYDIIDIQYLTFGWNATLFQRPQHIAKFLSENSVLVFYAMHQLDYEYFKYPIDKISKNCYIIDLSNPFLFKLLTRLVVNKKAKKFIHVYSTNNNYTYLWLQKMNMHFSIIYEYIDSIKLSNDSFIEERHLRIISNPKYYIVVTSSMLFNEVFKSTNNLRLISNGVDIDHWDNDVDNELYSLSLSPKKIRLGYYGALSPSWFDYDLLEKLIMHNDFHVILIGPLDYKGPSNESPRDKLLKYAENKSLTVIDKVPYVDLPKYLSSFDIAIIPFLVNEITSATSPIKIFEYMAAGKPIVTTYLPECNSLSYVRVASSHEEFIKMLYESIVNIKNIEYINNIKNESKKYSWSNKAKDFVDFIS